MGADLFFRADASISECGQYRYWLSRVWDNTLKPVCFVMLNPSTADAEQDDPTIRRCMAFARKWGGGGVYVVNLFAWRATDPRELRTAPDPVGPGNDWAIRCNAGCAPGCNERLAVVAAWGTGGTYRGRDREVVAMLRGVSCLGTTKDGHPRHPLYVAGNTALVPYPEDARGR